MRLRTYALQFSASALALIAPAMGHADDAATDQIAIADPAPEERVVSVEMRPFDRMLQRACEINYSRAVPVIAPRDGRLSLDVENGAYVQAGDVFARFDTADIDHQVDNVQLDINFLEAQLQYKSGTYIDNLSAIHDLNIEEKSSARDYLAAQVADMERLFGQGRLALGRLQEAQRKLASSNAELERVKRRNEMELREAQLVVLQLSRDLTKKQDELKALTLRQDRSSIAAPMAGEVSELETVPPGQSGLQVSAGRRLALLVDKTRLGARLSFSRDEMQIVRDADISIETALDGQTHDANIVAYHALETTRDSQRGNYRTEVEVSFSTERTENLVGSEALCIFKAPDTGTAPAVPVSAVMIRDDHSYVRKLDPNGPELIEVQLGDIANNYVRVLSGLRPGDRILE